MYKTMIHYEDKIFPFWCANQNHLYNFIAKKHQFYELELLESVRNLHGDGEKWLNIVDIGGNVGNHALFFAQFAHIVHVFEPQPGLWECLARNLKPYNNVELYGVALSDHHGMGSMRYPGGIESDHMAELEVEGGDVRIETLDDMDYRFNLSPDVIKIDVEGHEMKVLRGGEHTLRKYTPEIYIECRDYKSYREIYAYLKGFGYSRKEKFGGWGGWTANYHFSKLY